jgi:hypothetical protein
MRGGPTLELTERAINAGTDNCSMKDRLTRASVE